MSTAISKKNWRESISSPVTIAYEKAKVCKEAPELPVLNTNPDRYR